MTLRICHEWEDIKYIEATCPYCHVIDTYHNGNIEGDILQCSYIYCKKKFKLGEQE